VAPDTNATVLVEGTTAVALLRVFEVPGAGALRSVTVADFPVIGNSNAKLAVNPVVAVLDT
jgi:hypothetical protein